MRRHMSCSRSSEKSTQADARTIEPSLADSIQTINPLDHPEWDALVMTHPDYSFFQSRAWAGVLWNTYGFEPLYFTVQKGHCLLGLLSVMEVEGWLKGRRGVSLPFTDACLPLACGSMTGQSMVEHVKKQGVARRWKYFEWQDTSDHAAHGPPGGSIQSLTPAQESGRFVNMQSSLRANETCQSGSDNRSPVQDDPKELRLSPSLSFYGHIVPLASIEDDQFRRFDSGVRRAIRRAEGAGVKAEICRDLPSIGVFYDLHCRTRKKHGLPPQPFQFFVNIHRLILSQNLGFVCIAKLGKKPVAASIFFHFGKKAVYKYGASDERYLQVRGNNLVMWEAIRMLVREGFDALHLGRTSLKNEGLRRFKRGWAAEECRIEYFRYDFGSRSIVTIGDGVYGWQNWVFRALPMCVSRLVGKLLYKQMA